MKINTAVVTAVAAISANDACDAVAKAYGKKYSLDVYYFDTLWHANDYAGGGCSLHKPLPEAPGWGIIVFDREPYEGGEDDEGVWVFTKVGIYPL